jgi:hypothetical protein
VSGHPDPPASFHLNIVTVGWTWHRIHALARDPLHFGREPLHRFDAPAGELGVLYVARDTHGAFIETFGHATGVRFVTERELRTRGLVVVAFRRRLHLADLRSEGLARMGADAELTSGPDYAPSRRWARRSTTTRASPTAFSTGPDTIQPGSARDHRALLADLLDTYKFGLVP